MKTHGILMSAWSINKYTACLKTQTRRANGLDLVNSNPDGFQLIGTDSLGTLAGVYGKGKKDAGKWGAFFNYPESRWLAPDKPRRLFVPAPYGPAGDTLWFKETAKPRSALTGSGGTVNEFDLHYRADDDIRAFERDSHKPYNFHHFTPSIFMPRWAARFHDIPIVNVRVERLNDITKEDIRAEGIEETKEGEWLGADGYPFAHAHEAYDSIWNSINGKTLPSSMNPWLWVYEFKKFEGARVRSMFESTPLKAMK